jgi:hypothetical protein
MTRGQGGVVALLYGLLVRSSMLRSSLPVQRALLRIACALLLFAQHVGLAHAVLHAYKHVPPMQQQDGVQTERSQGPHAPKLSKLCAFDAVFGQVLGAAPPPVHSSAVPPASTETAVQVPHTRVVVEFLAPLSRGPPFFL